MTGLVGNVGPYDEREEQWSSYTERFACFVEANSIEDGKLVPTFLSVVGPKTFNLLRCLVQPDKPASKTYDSIVATLAAHFAPKPLLIAERFRFHKRNQEEGESVTVFVAALRKLAEHCEFNDVLNNTIRDRLVCGLRSEAAQKRLLTESALTLEKAVEIRSPQKKKEHKANVTDVTTVDILQLSVGVRTSIAGSVEKKDTLNALVEAKELKRNKNNGTKGQNTDLKRDSLYITCSKPTPLLGTAALQRRRQCTYCQLVESQMDTGSLHCWIEVQCAWKSTQVQQSPLCQRLFTKRNCCTYP